MTRATHLRLIALARGFDRFVTPAAIGCGLAIVLIGCGL